MEWIDFVSSMKVLPLNAIRKSGNIDYSSSALATPVMVQAYFGITERAKSYMVSNRVDL